MKDVANSLNSSPFINLILGCNLSASSLWEGVLYPQSTKYNWILFRAGIFITCSSVSNLSSTKCITVSFLEFSFLYFSSKAARTCKNGNGSVRRTLDIGWKKCHKSLVERWRKWMKKKRKEKREREKAKFELKEE